MLLPLLLGCVQPPPPDVVVVTWDTVRADRAGCTRDGVACTPLFTELAAEGVVFTEARAPTPETLPSHASLMTGQVPATHGARANGVFTLSDGATTLAERYLAAGYQTGAFISAPVLNRSTGVAQGFLAFNDRPGPPGLPYRAGVETTDAALHWLSTVPTDAPVFLWLHLFDAHRPLVPTVAELEAAGGDRYQAQIRTVDAQTRRLLDGLARAGRRDRSLLVITADHGEDLGDHGEETHSIFAYDATVRVPMLWWWGPDVPLSGRRGSEVDAPVSLIDVAPTLAEITGLGATPTDGLSLAGALSGAALPARTLLVESVTPVYALLTAPIFGYIDAAGQSWFSGPKPERYDLTADPDQQRNAYTPADTAALEALRVDRRWPPAGGEAALDAETRANLEALGYLGRGGDAVDAATDTAVARDRMATIRFGMASFADPDALMDAYRAALEVDGPSPHLVSAAVGALDGMGALIQAEALLAEHPDQAKALASRQATRAEKEALLPRIQAFLASPPPGAQLADAWYDLGVTLRYLERHAEARGALERALDLRPADTAARVELSRVLRSLGETEGAIAVLEAAQPAQPCEIGRLSSLTEDDARTAAQLEACQTSGAPMSHRDVRILAEIRFGATPGDP